MPELTTFEAVSLTFGQPVSPIFLLPVKKKNAKRSQRINRQGRHQLHPDGRRVDQAEKLLLPFQRTIAVSRPEIAPGKQSQGPGLTPEYVHAAKRKFRQESDSHRIDEHGCHRSPPSAARR
jgi:hypothetical protein